MTDQLTPRDFCNPAILLAGSIDQAMYGRFREQLDAAPEEGLIVCEVGTLGGDPEIARMMGADVRFHAGVEPERRFVFLGKAAVYSAGATFMSFFPRRNRYLVSGTRLMIHERQMSDSVRLAGPLTSCPAILKAKLHEIEHSILIQNEGFASLVEDSKVTLEEVKARALTNWYIEAEEARALRLVEGVIS
ncbi:MAG TPA: peptidase S14 [Caulobacteraceae bacterium]|jgi:hypothetical protein